MQPWQILLLAPGKSYEKSYEKRYEKRQEGAAGCMEPWGK
jgi:hypothetical protein